MENTEDYCYVQEHITRSAATLQIIKCRPRDPDVEDILVIKKQSIVLLCQQDKHVWLTELEQELQRPIRHAVIVSTAKRTDVLAMTDNDGTIYFLVFAQSSFKIIRRFGAVQLNDRTTPLENHHLSSDPGGRALCTVSSEEEITIYSLSKTVDGIELTARNIFRVPGFMLKSCFLLHNNILVSLIVHISAGTWSRLLLIHWKAGEGLDSVQPREMPLDSDLSLCLLMIGLNRRPGYFLHITATSLSLISSYHVQCGDLSFERCPLSLGAALPTAIIEIEYGDEQHLALLASDDGSIMLVNLDTYGNLSVNVIGSLPITPSSWCLLTPDEETQNAFVVFLASDNGQSGLFEIHKDENIQAKAIFIENLPLMDVHVHDSGDNPARSQVVTIAGNHNGSINFQYLALVPVPVRDVQLPGLDRPPECLFSALDRFGKALLLVSMPWGTQLLQYLHEEEDLFDVSDDFGIDSGSPTLLFCSFGESFFQICASGIYSCKDLQAEKVPVLVMGAAQIITLAGFYANVIAVTIWNGEMYSLKLFTVIKLEEGGFATQEILHNFKFAVEPTVMRYQASPGDANNGDALLMLCFADNRFVLIKHSTNDLSMLLNQILESESDCFDVPDFSMIAHDCSLLVSANKWHVLLTYHNGYMNHFQVTAEHLAYKGCRRLSRGPIKLMPDQQDHRELYFSGESSGRVHIYNDELAIDKIIFPQRQPESIIYSLDPFFNPEVDAGRAAGLLCYESGWLTFYTIPKNNSDTHIAIDIAETPRRILYLTHLDCYVIATRTTNSLKSGGNICIVQHGSVISESPIRDSRKDVEIFRSGDTIFALIQWRVMINGKERLWTIVGSCRTVSKTSSIEGRLTVLRLKQNGTKIDVRKEFSPSYPGPIYALCVYDETCLVIAHGNSLEVTMLDIESRALATQSKVILRSPAISIHVSRPFVFVATQKDSVMVFQFVDKLLLLVAADPYPRLSVSLSVIDDKVLVLTDKLKTLSVYDWSVISHKLKLKCTIQMPTVIVRTKKLSIAHHDSSNSLSSIIPDPFVILAAGLDGSLHVVFRIMSRIGTAINDHRKKESYDLFNTSDLSFILSSMSEKELEALLGSNDSTDVSGVKQAIITALQQRTARLLA